MAWIKAYLTLIGDQFDPEWVTERIGIKPDSVRLPSELLSNGRLFGHTEWGVETEKLEADDVETVLEQLFLRVKVCMDDMGKLAEEASAAWNILVYVKSEACHFPYIIFSAETIRNMAKMKATIGFDTYIYDECS